MPGHKVGTREEWSAARKELLEREQELGKLDEELAKQRKELPWVPVRRSTPSTPRKGRGRSPSYYQLLDQIPDGRDADFPLRRHDEY